MWIEELKNGNYKFCDRYKDPYTGKTKKISVTLSKNTAAAKKEAAALLQNKISKACGSVDDSKTLQELCELYISYQKNTVSAGTVRRNEQTCKTICRKLNPLVLVQNLNAGYVGLHLFDASEKPCTKNERLARFKALMRWGYQNDYISDIKWLDKLLPLNDKEGKEKLANKYLERDELNALIDAMNVPQWKQLTQMMALTGARIGEILALEIQDVDFTNQIITIDKTLDAVIKNDVHSPKTRCSNREISMQPELEALCKDIKKDLNTKRLKYGIRTKIFLCDIQGEHLSYYAFNKYLKRISTKVLGRTVTTHVLRHTHVSLLAEAGIPLETITRRVGHEDSRITKNIYLHVTEKMKEKDKELMSSVNLLA